MFIKSRARFWRLTGLSGAALATVMVTGAGAQAAVPAAQASVTRGHPVTNPFSPIYKHPYLRDAFPSVPQLRKMRLWARTHRMAWFNSTAPLTYHGGVDGIGVTTGHEQVYLVFYGSQWGTQGTNASGDLTLSGDTDGEAPYLQQFLKGLGTDNETWSGVATQYCQGIAAGAASCPASNPFHVAYPLGGALAGVWADESTASPAQATSHQLAQEAVNAAAHFGNTTLAANRDAQYVIVSPPGTNPEGLFPQDCGRHDYSTDPGLGGGPVTSPYGDLAFTNLPYVPSQGSNCGAGAVNSPGTLDGVSIVEGHEYTETITDQNLGGGWYGTNLGDEIGDRCAWIAPGTPGGMADLSLATGAFAVQSMWANDANGGAGACDISHPAVTNPPATGPVFGIYGKCVDVRGGSPAPQTPVQIFTCNGTPAQRWTVTPGATGDTLQALGQCLDVKGAGTANNTPVRIFTCNSTPAQVWVPLDGELINPNSGRCLDDPSGSSTNGTQLQIYDCHQSDNQAWELPS